MKRSLINTARKTVLSANKAMGNYQDVIWLFGSGRSGTTWVSDMLNYGRGYREMIEPFRPLLIDDMKFLSLNQYVRPDSNFQQLDIIARKVFNGRFTHPDVDNTNKRLTYKGLFIKDVFANLFAYYLWKQFPHIKPALILRNPFEVALSKQKMSHWNWTTDPRDFLHQPSLVKDYLSPYVNLIERIGSRGDAIEKHIAVWCIINYIPLRQFKEEDLYVLFYEEVASNTQSEVQRFWKTINSGRFNKNILIPESLMLKPSSVSQELNKIVNDSDWRSKISDRQFENGVEILNAFGFGKLYKDGVPDRKELSFITNG